MGVWFNSMPSMGVGLIPCHPWGLVQFWNASRMVHIPFFRPETEVTEAEKRDAEEILRAAHITTSSCMGELIAIGQHFSTACTGVHVSYNKCNAHGHTGPTRAMPLC